MIIYILIITLAVVIITLFFYFFEDKNLDIYLSKDSDGGKNYLKKQINILEDDDIPAVIKYKDLLALISFIIASLFILLFQSRFIAYIFFGAGFIFLFIDLLPGRKNKIKNKKEIKYIKKIEVKEHNQNTDYHNFSSNNIFYSKTFWIIAGVLIIFYFIIENSDNTTLTQKDLRKNETICTKWGGQILRNSDNEFIDCSINGRLESSY